MLRTRVVRSALLASIALIATTSLAHANPHAGQSSKVGIIGDASSINGGILPTTTSGPTGSFTDFTFTNVTPASVNPATLAGFDTIVLNVASRQMNCNVNTLTSAQKTDVVNFLKGGGKLVIYDSECPPQDYSFLPHPFTTSNPGQLGGRGTVNIAEDNFLGSDTQGDTHFIDKAKLGQQTDAVGDMNVLTTRDPNICAHMFGTNAQNQSGPTHVYYQSGSGLLIYDGFDIDFLSPSTSPDAATPEGNLAKIWLQELQQPLDGQNLKCAAAVVGIALTPAQATNPVGTSHTLTAKVTDQGGNPRSNVLVTFTVKGANPNPSGTCNPSNCRTDANGEVTFTYTGRNAGDDKITACFTPPNSSSPVCSREATKTWRAASASADLSIDKQAPARAKNGQNYSYTLKVANAGPDNATGVVATDKLPAGVTFVSASQGYTQSSGTVTCQAGTVNAGASKTFTITVRPRTQGAKTNNASVKGNEPDPNTRNNSDSATTQVEPGPPRSLALSPKSATNPVDAQHCVTATVKDEFGAVTPNEPVDFKVTGTNSPTGSATTGSNGQARFCWSSAFPGDDRVTATARNGSKPSDTATKKWVVSGDDDCKIHGNGEIVTAAGDEADFHLKVDDKDEDHKKGKPKDDIRFEDEGTHGLEVEGKKVDADFACSSDLTTATIFALVPRDPDGKLVRVRIDVIDARKNKSAKDKYRIRTPNGYDSGLRPVTHGSIKISHASHDSH